MSDATNFLTNLPPCLAALNSPPEAQDDDVSTDENTPLLINVLINNGHGPDFDIDGNLDPNLTINLNNPSMGILTNNNDGTFNFDPNGEFNLLGGQSQDVTFDYQIEDHTGRDRHGHGDDHGHGREPPADHRRRRRRRHGG